jgi:hypothetical protein
MEFSVLDDVDPIIKKSDSRQLLIYRIQAEYSYPPYRATGYFEFKHPVDI